MLTGPRSHLKSQAESCEGPNLRREGRRWISATTLSDEAPAAVTLSDPSNVQSGQVGLSWTESGAVEPRRGREHDAGPSRGGQDIVLGRRTRERRPESDPQEGAGA